MFLTATKSEGRTKQASRKLGRGWGSPAAGDPQEQGALFPGLSGNHTAPVEACSARAPMLCMFFLLNRTWRLQGQLSSPVITGWNFFFPLPVRASVELIRNVYNPEVFMWPSINKHEPTFLDRLGNHFFPLLCAFCVQGP